MVSATISREADSHSQLSPLLKQAVSAHQAGQLEAARPLYREFLTQEPKNPTALQLFGLLHSQSGEYETAIRLMRESLSLFPDQAEVANNLGNALSGAGRLKEAVDSYGQAVRLNPRYVDALRNLGLSYLQLDIVDDAQVCFERCVRTLRRPITTWASASG